jgi:predicted metal-dependent hydrolase
MSDLAAPDASDCLAPLHPKAMEGLELFNHGQYFEAHEALEAAWREETKPIRELYRGVLQAAVVYLHITRGNLAGAVKVYTRCTRWLDCWPETCQGIAVGKLRQDLQIAVHEFQSLGPGQADRFDRSLLKPVVYGAA